MLSNSDIVILTAAFYLASVFSQFFTAISRDIILPILSPITAAQKDVAAFTIRIGNIELRIGNVLSELVNLVIALGIVVFTVGLLKSYVLPAVGARRVA